MFDKLIEVKRRYEEINQLLMDPTVINDNTRYRNLMKEYKNLTPLIEKYGFKPSTSIEDGLAKFVEWYKEYYNV